MNYLFYIFFLLFLVYNTNKYVHRFILYFLGFDIDLKSIKNLTSKVILISSHTSVYDFFIGMFIYYGYMHNEYDNYILMKKEFEKYTAPFLNLVDTKLKLIEVEKKKSGLVNQIIEQIRYKDNYIIYISPEGTRKYIETLRSGYWAIAKELNLDVSFVGIDFYNKSITFEKPRKVEQYWEDEINNFKKISLTYRPLFPENCYFYNKDKTM